MFFSKSMRDEQITDEDLDRLSAHKLNGRQVRRIFLLPLMIDPDMWPSD